MATTNISSSGVLGFNDTTGAVQLPSGTTAERPGSPSNGEMRYNTTDNKVEYYDGANWIQFSLVSLPPSVTTSAASSVTDTSMTLNGDLTDLGGATTGTVGFYFGTSTNYASNTKYTVSTTASTGVFSYNATGLTGNTDYYINAFAINDGGETVGSQVSQTTPFVPQFTLASTSSYWGSTTQEYADPDLRTYFYDPSTTAFVLADYFQTGNGVNNTLTVSHYNGTADFILNGCRGNSYGQPYSASFWGTSPTCNPQLSYATNTTTRAQGGTYFNYYRTNVGIIHNTQPPSGYTLSNRSLDYTGSFTGHTINTDTSSQMKSTVTSQSGSSYGALIHEFDLV